MGKHYMKREKNSHCIKIGDTNSLGFVIIDVGHHRGMTQITQDALERDFIQCDKPFFDKMIKRAKEKNERRSY